MEWCVRLWLYAISFSGCERRQRSERTCRLAVRRLPVQAILLARVADELRRRIVSSLRHREGGEVLRLAFATAPQTSIIASSFRPTRRFRTSSLPAAISKNHCPSAFFFSGIGKGKLSAPTKQDSSTIRQLAPTVHHPIPYRERWRDIFVLHGSPEEISSFESGAKIASNAF